jgi:hypothetical protein
MIDGEIPPGLPVHEHFGFLIFLIVVIASPLNSYFASIWAQCRFMFAPSNPVSCLQFT